MKDGTNTAQKHGKWGEVKSQRWVRWQQHYIYTPGKGQEKLLMDDFREANSRQVLAQQPAEAQPIFFSL